MREVKAASCSPWPAAWGIIPSYRADDVLHARASMSSRPSILARLPLVPPTFCGVKSFGWTARRSGRVEDFPSSAFPRTDRSRRPCKLGRSGPPIVYGIGRAALLECGGLAVVGSRRPDSSSQEYTE